jgi:DNA mismatch endonuclease (patch repair protein)
MRANRRVSALEHRLRSALWAAGARGYRVQSKLPGRPDIIFPRERIAILVHGCFWHRCPTCQLPEPKANAEFWVAKLAENGKRDALAEETLHEQGWKVVVVWEHEFRAGPQEIARRLIEMRRSSSADLPTQPAASKTSPPGTGRTPLGVRTDTNGSRLIQGGGLRKETTCRTPRHPRRQS